MRQFLAAVLVIDNPDRVVIGVEDDVLDLAALDEAQRVEFEITQGDKGPQASNVQPI